MSAHIRDTKQPTLDRWRSRPPAEPKPAKLVPLDRASLLQVQRSAGNAAATAAVRHSVDVMRASIQRAFQAMIPSTGNADLIAEALRLDPKIFEDDSEVGPEEKAAVAETLVKIFETLDSRIKTAPTDDKGIPTLGGVTWPPGDPLAGIIEGIKPFGNKEYFWDPLVSRRPGKAISKKKPKPAPPGAKTIDIEVGEEVTAEAGPRGTDRQVIAQAIREVARSSSRWKDRVLRMLAILRDESCDDRVIQINPYLYANQPPATTVLDPDPRWTFHLRPDLLRALRRQPRKERRVSEVERLLEIVHVTFQWARSLDNRESQGGGTTRNLAERKAYDWIANQQGKPNSVYSAWND